MFFESKAKFKNVGKFLKKSSGRLWFSSII